ncbi:MAG: pentapeptide repeat-containing protein [Pseudomonadales bacterium]
MIERKEEIEKLRIRLESTKKSISAISNSIDVFEKLNFPRTVVNREAIFDESTFRSVASFAGCSFSDSVIFSDSSFSGNVFFNNVSFSQGPVFDNASMRNASFDGTDLRGVDLSKAIVDSGTELPSKWAAGKFFKNLTKKSSCRDKSEVLGRIS